MIRGVFVYVGVWFKHWAPENLGKGIVVTTLER